MSNLAPDIINKKAGRPDQHYAKRLYLPEWRKVAIERIQRAEQEASGAGHLDADSESVKELVEQGNAFEAAAVDGVQNAKDPDVSEVTTRQVPGG